MAKSKLVSLYILGYLQFAQAIFMGITYKIDVEKSVVISTAEGRIGAEELLANLYRFSADPLYNSDFGHLFDGRSAQISFSGNEAQKIAEWFREHRPKSKTALVINKKTLGFARMYHAWREDFTHISYEMASAREWLGLPPEVES